MKSLFDSATRDGVMTRIHSLQPAADRHWGKMNPAQMLAHCSATLAMATGESVLPRAFLGRIIGPLFKRRFVGEAAFRKNGPTSPALVVADQREFLEEKERLLRLVGTFGTNGPEGCTKHPHPFFGALSPLEWGIIMYKHLDHHLNQFGA
jgi:hypothetical protein